MPDDKMYLVITLRKEVPDRETGYELYLMVKDKLEDRPDLVVTGHVTNHFEFGE